MIAINLYSLTYFSSRIRGFDQTIFSENYAHFTSSYIICNWSIKQIKIKHIAHWCRELHLRMVFLFHILFFFFYIFLCGILILLGIPSLRICPHISRQLRFAKEDIWVLVVGVEDMDHMTFQQEQDFSKVHSRNQLPQWFHRVNRDRQSVLELGWCFQGSYWRMDDHKWVNTYSYRRHGKMGNLCFQSKQEELRGSSEVWVSFSYLVNIIHPNQNQNFKKENWRNYFMKGQHKQAYLTRPE